MEATINVKIPYDEPPKNSNTKTRGGLPKSPMVEMENIYPDADMKLDGEDSYDPNTEEMKAAAAVYLVDIFVVLPPSVWMSNPRYVLHFIVLFHILHQLHVLSPSMQPMGKGNKKKNKKHLAVATKASNKGQTNGCRIVQLPPTVSNKDTFLTVRQTLSELQETAHITCFHLELTVAAEM